MKLVAFDFSIEHRSKKSNFADASSKRSDYYEEVNEHAQQLFFTLCSKLNVMTTLQTSAASELFKIIVNVLQTVNLHIEDETSKSRIASSWSIYILDKKDATATQRIFCRVTTIIIENEDSYKNNTQFITKIIKSLQEQNEFVKDYYVEVRFVNSRRTRGAFKIFVFDDNKLLRYHDRAYISLEAILWQKLLKRHHDDSLTKHFEVEKTQHLLAQKYYWSNMSKDIKKYVKTCDVC